MNKSLFVLGIVLSLSLGFMFGMLINNNYKNMDIDFKSAEVISSTEHYGKMLDEQDIFYDALIEDYIGMTDDCYDWCDERVEEYRTFIEEELDKAYDWCDERVEEYRTFIEEEC